MQIWIDEVSERIARMIPKVGIGFRDDRISQRLGKILWIGIAEGNVTARRVILCECENNILARAIIDARGLEEKSIGWVEEGWENLRRREIVRQADV
jgi:hypothetical protein